VTFACGGADFRLGFDGHEIVLRHYITFLIV
jgi:hypothetical protein